MKNYEVHVQNWKDGELEHDYNLSVDYNNTAVVTRTHNSNWTEDAKGKTVGALLDDGDGIKIELPNRKVIKLDYSEASIIQMLLMANSGKDFKTEFKESKTVLRYSGLAD